MSLLPTRTRAHGSTQALPLSSYSGEAELPRGRAGQLVVHQIESLTPHAVPPYRMPSVCVCVCVKKIKKKEQSPS